jgi:hypothetical protein
MKFIQKENGFNLMPEDIAEKEFLLKRFDTNSPFGATNIIATIFGGRDDIFEFEFKN